ncbi:MAG: MaoC family dehydratase [Hyphomonadaceae bacterium]|nr:MaoC family dehydratase [Hyphomonadaceae bacterium]
MREVALADLPGLVGQEIGASEWLTISQDRVDEFARATGDDQWIHIDVERAKREMGGTIAHGYLTLSLIPVMARDILKITGVGHGVNYGSDKVRFTNMVRVGARIRLKQKVLACEPRAGGFQLKNEFTMEVEGESRPACVAETIAILYPTKS